MITKWHITEVLNETLVTMTELVAQADELSIRAIRHGASYAEIAELWGISPQAAWARYHEHIHH